MTATAEHATRAAARIAAVSGFVFAGLFVAALVLLHRAPNLSDPDQAYAAFYAGGGDQIFVAVGLYLVPYAGIAFLWHMTAIRNVLDTLTPSPSAMAHGLNLLAGAIFVTLMFAGTAAVGRGRVRGVLRSHARRGPGGGPGAHRRRLRARLHLRGPRGRDVRPHHHDAAAQRRGAVADPVRRRLPARRLPAGRRDQQPRRRPRLPGVGRPDLGLPAPPRRSLVHNP